MQESDVFYLTPNNISLNQIWEMSFDSKSTFNGYTHGSNNQEWWGIDRVLSTNHEEKISSPDVLGRFKVTTGCCQMTTRSNRYVIYESSDKLTYEYLSRKFKCSQNATFRFCHAIVPFGNDDLDSIFDAS